MTTARIAMVLLAMAASNVCPAHDGRTLSLEFLSAEHGWALDAHFATAALVGAADAAADADTPSFDGLAVGSQLWKQALVDYFLGSVAVEAITLAGPEALAWGGGGVRADGHAVSFRFVIDVVPSTACALRLASSTLAPNGAHRAVVRWPGVDARERSVVSSGTGHRLDIEIPVGKGCTLTVAP